MVHAFCCHHTAQLFCTQVARGRAHCSCASSTRGSHFLVSRSPASTALMFHHREWQKEQHKLKVCCLKVPHRRARPVRPCRVLHPCLRTCVNQPRCAQPSSKRAGYKPRRLLSKLQKSRTRVPHSRSCNRSDNVFDCTCGYEGEGPPRSRGLQQLLAANPSSAPSTSSSSSADSNFLSQLQLTSEEHRQQVADEKELVEEGELARKLQQSARAALEQQRQADAVVEKERQKKEKEVARKKKKADYMAAKRQDSEFRQRERDKRRYG